MYPVFVHFSKGKKKMLRHWLRLASTAAFGEVAEDGGVDGAGGGEVLVGSRTSRGGGDAGRVGDLGQGYRMVVT